MKNTIKSGDRVRFFSRGWEYGKVLASFPDEDGKQSVLVKPDTATEPMLLNASGCVKI
jgi:hypothetical protein